MEYFYRVSKTDLARKTRQVFRSVQRGQTVIVESHGQPEAAILDIQDYYILRAVTHYHAQPPQIDPEAGLPDEALAGIQEAQERYNLVIAHYLAGAISLGRAAELLELPWVDLRARLNRLYVPMRFAPETVEEAREDARVAKEFSRKARE